MATNSNYRTYGRTVTGRATGTRAGASMSIHGQQFAGSGELITATLRGYRCWSLDGNKLKAVSHGVTWDKSSLIATCNEKVRIAKQTTTTLKGLAVAYINGSNGSAMPVTSDITIEEGPHENVPSSVCTCGIYGWYEPESALREHTQVVMGVVECKGIILLGTTGFRAQEAKIVAIAPGNNGKINEHIRMQRGNFHHTELHKYVYYENGKTVISYDELNEAMKRAGIRTRDSFMESLNQVGADYDVEVFESMEALKLIYPPQLDTLENILEGKLKRYGTLA